MRRAVLAQPDGVMRHDVDDAHAHQRGQSYGGTTIIGEHQERAGIGDDAAMQRHAVHGGGHAVFAHAVVDETAGVIGRAHRRHRFGARVVGAGEIGRAADHFRQCRDQALECEFASRAGGDVLRRGGEALLDRTHRVGKRRLRQVAFHAALEFGALSSIERGEALAPVGMRALRSLAGLAPSGQNVGGNVEWRVAPAQLLARAFDLVGAERRTMR